MSEHYKTAMYTLLHVLIFIPFEAWHASPVAKVHSLHEPVFHIGASSCPRCSTSHPAPYLWPGKVVVDSPRIW